jgi:16S rRNA (guanine1207-N2)-methyltransferase
LPGAPACGFFWHDLAGEKVEKKYELIVMNPPFHQGRAAEPSIGQAMIRQAASALKSGGRLLLVHNRGLPYEQVLKAGFSEVEEIAAAGGFRVIAASR